MDMLLEIRADGAYVVNEYDEEEKADVLNRISNELQRMGTGHYLINITRCGCQACQEGFGEHAWPII